MSNDLSVTEHISNTTRNAFFELYRLKQVQPFLSPAAIKILVLVLVISRLDYANSLLTGCTKKELKATQSAQDVAARMIVRNGSISTERARFELHWLPIEQRIDFKVLTV